MISAFEAGHFEKARGWHRKLFPLCRDLLGAASNPIPIKIALRLVGRDTGELRLPLCGPEQPVIARIESALRDYGLLEQGGVDARARKKSPKSI
jgi:4-hydroxy-tetrahydrodipicolinate synthase